MHNIGNNYLPPTKWSDLDNPPASIVVDGDTAEAPPKGP